MQFKRKSTTTIFGCVFAVFLPKICFADKICTAPSEPVTIKENNADDTVVVHINTTTKDVTLNLTENPGNSFYLRGSELIAKKGLDFETLSGPEELTVQVRCNKTGYRSITLIVIVRVENINDNNPSFGQSEYTLNVNELTPVNTSIGLIEAIDDDSEVLYYSIEPTLNRYFRLENMYTPKILVNKVLDYDVIQQVKLILYAQDTPLPLQHTPLPSQPSERSFTATATITVNIKDIDNRPPWFQPCTRVTTGNAKICLSLGYRGRVNLTEKQDGALQLQPGPVYARDGDKSRNEEISYKIVRGNEDNIFQIDENSGNISMLKPADIAGPISLLVLASQVLNRDQFATTSVTIDVMKKSRNPPRFEKERYEGYVYISSGPENMVLRDRTTNRPFRVRARDEDFASGINPDIKYEVQYSSYVNITTDGFILLKKAVRTDSFALQLRAVDVSTGESGTAALAVLVIPSAGVQSPDESFRAGDMALLGFVMAALLVLCLIVIGYLISRVKKGNPDAFKLSECLGSCLKFTQPPNRPRPRDSMQFNNDGFLNEGDTGRSRARRAELREGRLDAVQAARVRVIPRERLRHCRSCGLQTSFNHSHHSPVVQTKGKANKQRVKSILAKERRKDDRHKSVWFKESEDSSDIEVEIIPDTIGIKPEEEVEKVEGDFASHPLEDSQMELGDLIMSNIQDLSSREISDGRDGLNTDRKDP
ncbi:cadherin-related family member 5 [Rhinichthys klamathensis goyatoka]|uniref:cadherin-related family member 5 n=1 Tax=Rhinichthys klamathensis goyatoka TaxID=3034132 RepID=UPI0024B4B796|nr:cadherin-related family member 5 [Rhinichthys klamathensis goyatoka]